MLVSKTLRRIVLGLIISVALAACGVDDSDSPAARPPTAVPEDSPTVTPDDRTPPSTVTPSPTTPQETPSDDGLLTVGDRGAAVKEIQSMLKALGHDLTVDGVFGPTTEEAVVSFEMETGLPSDGAVGAEERRALEAALNDQEQGDTEEKNESGESDGESQLRPGDEGKPVRRLQRDLEKLGYWVGPRDGAYETLTEQAVLALQGVEGLSRDGIFGPNTRAALKNASRPKPRVTSGNHIEIDEARGVILVVRGGKAEWIIHTSTGTERNYEHPDGSTQLADTPNGRWTFSWEVDGWRDGRLGRMWRPKYFHRDGIAIHGYPTVPAYPASHGCARVTMAAMDFIWENNLAPQGSTVIVYGRG